MAENKYQAKLIKKLEEMFPGCEVLKNDPSYKQGILDLTIFFGKRWGMLEVKDSLSARRRPNQEYYVKKLNDMSFASFICPENEKEVLAALQKALSPRRSARVSKS